MSTETINLALKFSYIGKNYHGNALQGDLNTVSYQLTKVLKKLNIYITDPILCGRTDKGVNAKNMVCNISVKKLTNCNYANYLNYHLPTDISIKSYAIVPETFHARYNCIQRHCRYYFTDYNPIMDEVCTRLKLVRDFKGMCKDEKDTKRTLDAIYIEKKDGLYVLNVKAKGFLYNMVRKIFWVLSHAHLQSIDGILEGKQMAGTAGPEGLVFCCAKYECEIGWIDAYRKNDRKKWMVQKEIEKFINDF